MKKVVILGSGEHAVVVIDALRAIGEFDLIGCIADDTDPTRLVCGLPIIGRADMIETLKKNGISAAIGLGGWNNNNARRELFNQASDLGLDIVPLIHPAAYVAPSAMVGRGSVILHGTYIGAETVVGENVIVHVNSTIHHQTVIENHALISSHVCVGANVKIEEAAFLAMGANVVSKLTIGRETLVASGAVVVRDAAPNERLAGVPAKPF